MKSSRWFLIFTFVFGLAAANSFAQSNIVKKDLSPAEIDRIVKTFARHEGEFRGALAGYVFNRSATIQSIGLGGQITGTFRRDSFLNLAGDGVRVEKILFAPISTLTDIQVSPQDIDNLSGVDPFAIDPALVGQYNFAYLGTEKIDELNLHVFDVTPKSLPDPKKSKQKFFSGRIWVDDRDLMIVKSKGKALPEAKDERFPVIETTRENVDGKYWFPSYSASDDELVFDTGQVVKIRVRVKYTNYTVGKSQFRILDDDTEEQPKPTPTPAPKKP